MTIGERLKKIREDRGLSQKQAAALVGMQQQAWRVYETDSSMPGAKLIMKICQQYSVSSDWLLGIEHDLPTVSVNGNGNAVVQSPGARVVVNNGVAGEMPQCLKCPHKKLAERMRKLMA